METDADIDAALAETVAYLESDAAETAIRLDPYWPKWESPWWRMLLLHELGLAGRIPARAVRALVEALDRRYVHFFPLTESELPPGVDPVRQVPCHCQLGTVAEVLRACGVDVARELGWVRAWFFKYQLPDGGLNCDEAAYTRAVPRSSFVSTLPPAEAVLGAATPAGRPLAPDEARFLERAADYLLRRRLARSLSKGLAIANPEWLTPCFPRFYEYDVLRGLRFLARWAARTGTTLPRDGIAETVAALDALLGEGAPLHPPSPGFAECSAGPAPRRFHEGKTTFRPDAAGAWQRGRPAGTFPLLDAVARPEVGGALIRREWAETRALLACAAAGIHT